MVEALSWMGGVLKGPSVYTGAEPPFWCVLRAVQPYSTDSYGMPNLLFVFAHVIDWSKTRLRT